MIDVTVHLDEEQEAVLRRYLALIQTSSLSLTIEDLVQTMVNTGVFYGVVSLVDPKFLREKNVGELSNEIAQHFLLGGNG